MTSEDYSYDGGGRLSELSFDQLLQLHAQVLDNWTRSGGVGDGSQYDVVRLPAVRLTIVIAYVVIIIVGVVGNGLVVVVAARRVPRSSNAAKGWQSATYVFVVCLAVSDLALCLFSLPVQLHYQLTDNWHLGALLCRVVFAAFAVPIYLSAVTIMLIAVDRYLLIVRPFGDRLSARRAVWLVALNVAVSTLLAAPVVNFTNLQVLDEDPEIGLVRMTLCVERWDSRAGRRVYSVFAFVIQFCLPLVATATLYGRIYARLRLRCRRALSGRPRGSDIQRTSSAVMEPESTDCGRSSMGLIAASNVASRTNKTNRILAAIVVNFVVCWLPWNVFGLITELDHTVVRGRHFKLVDLALKGFAMISACVNPLLYFWLNENLRRDLGSLSFRLDLFRCRRPRSPGAVGPERQAQREAANQADELPRLNIQPPSSAVDSAPGGVNIRVGPMICREPESSDCPPNTSFLVMSDMSSFGSANGAFSLSVARRSAGGYLQIPGKSTDI